jgi:hypothetical protein
MAKRAHIAASTVVGLLIADTAAVAADNCTNQVGPGAPGGSEKNLSDQLSGSGGVICPPANVDPDMKAPAPGGGRTPVIPPPGSPGGNPSVQPK